MPYVVRTNSTYGIFDSSQPLPPLSSSRSSSLGDILQRRLPRILTPQRRQLLLVAGAAACVAAIFKAPATGAVFAIGRATRRP